MIFCLHRDIFMFRHFLLIVLFFSSSVKSALKLQLEKKKHFVYHPGYDISFLGLEKLHPFDTCKYSKIASQLVDENVVESWQDFHQPKEVNPAYLTDRIHAGKYIAKLNCQTSKRFSVISGAASQDIPLHWVPNWLIDWIALKPMRLATQGTVEAMELALKNQWAINLSGGYHHAKYQGGHPGGFCVYNDAALAAHEAITKHGLKKILIVDLDAHQGNGNEDIFTRGIFKGKVTVLDMYNAQAYPTEEKERKRITQNQQWYSIPAEGMNDKEYLSLLEKTLYEAIFSCYPDLIIYNAGTDIYEKDPLGKMKITAQGIKNRDKYVFEQAKKYKIPIVMMLSGGYTAESAKIIASSIREIFLAMSGDDKLAVPPMSKIIKRLIPFKTIFFSMVCILLYMRNNLLSRFNLS